MRKILIFFCYILSLSQLKAQWNIANLNDNIAMKGIWSPTENTMYACAAYDKIYKSTNNGKDWITVFSNSDFYYFYDIQFSTASNGIVVGNQVNKLLILHTKDGGQNWKTATFPTNATFPTLHSVDFATAQVGFAVGSGSALLKTIDGGENWLPVTNNLAQGLEIIDIDVPNANTLYVTTFDGLMFGSDDSGATWYNILAPNGTPQKIQFLDKNKGFSLNNDQTFMLTNDGGENWQIQSQMPAPVNQFWMTDANNGFAVGQNGVVLKTIDGGKNWIAQRSDISSQNLFDVHFFNSQKGGIAGQNPDALLLHTDKSGGIAAQIKVANYRKSQNIAYCQGDTIQLKAQTIGATAFSWKINGIQVSNAKDFDYIILKDDVNIIDLEASNSVQTLKTTSSINVTSNPLQIIEVSDDGRGACEKETVKLTLKNINQFSTYFLRVNNQIIADDLKGFDDIQVKLPPYSDKITIEIWLKDPQGCGNRKLATYSLQYYKRPSSTLKSTITSNPVCENQEVKITVLSPESSMLYQIYKDNLPFGDEKVANQPSILLSSLPIKVSSKINIKASSSLGCFVFLENDFNIIVKTIEPFFSISTVNIGIGEAIKINNNSADSLQCKWNFGPNANPASSNDKKPKGFYYTSTGSENIELEVISPTGCKEILSKKVTIYDTVGLDKDWLRVQNTRPFPIFEEELDKFAVDNEGNMYASGKSATSYRLFSTAGIAYNGKESYVTLLSKHNTLGVYQWHLLFNNLINIKALQVAKNQNIFALLHFKGNENLIEFHIPSRDGKIVKIKQVSGIVLVEYSPSGTIENYTIISENCGSFNSLEANCFSVNENKEIVVYGTTLSNCNEKEIEVGGSNLSVYKEKLGNQFRQFSIFISPSKTKVDGYSLIGTSNGISEYLRPQKVILDSIGNRYLLSSGETLFNQSAKTISIQKLDKNLKNLWEYQAFCTQTQSNGTYILANDIVLTPQGNIAFIGSVFGSSDFGAYSLQGGIPTVNISMLDGHSGKMKWHRYIWASGQVIFNQTQPALGLSIAGNKLYAKVRFEGINASIHSVPNCLNLDNAMGADEFIFKLDTTGNLLQVIDCHTNAILQNPLGAGSSLASVKGNIYSFGQAASQGSVGNLTFNNSFSGNYLARIKDDQAYLPYITTPFVAAIDYNCELKFCSDKNNTLTISDVFSNIQWKKDGIAIANQTKNFIYPKDNGVYTVEATNPAGTKVTSPDGINVKIELALDNKLTQKGDSLVAVFYDGAYYIWEDTSLQIIALGVELNKFKPNTKSPVRCSISSDACSSESDFYTIKPLSSKENVFEKTLIKPNPSNGVFDIQLSNPISAELKIYNLLGQEQYREKLQNEDTIALDLNHLSEGEYYIYITNEKEHWVSKVIIQK